MNGFAAPRASIAFLSVLAVGVAGCGGSPGPVDGEAAYAHTEAIVALSPRPTGSEALRKVGGYITGQLARIGLEPREQVWKQTVDAYGEPRELELRNLWTEIPGKDPEKGPILLIGCHYDSKLCAGHPHDEQNFEFVGAIDAAAASGVLIELARTIHAHQTRARAGGDSAPDLIVPNVWIVFFDGEECVEFEWTDDKSLLGSRHFAETFAADKQRFPNGLSARLKAMVLLDLIGDRKLKIDRDTRSNPKLLEIFRDAAAGMGEEDRMYRYESPMVDDHVPFKRFGVAVIDLIDFRWRTAADWERTAEEWARAGVEKPPEGSYTAWWHTADDTLEHVSAASLAFVGNLVWRALPGIEAAFYTAE